MPKGFSSDSRAALVYLTVSAAVWGGVFHVIRYPLAEAPPFVMLAARFSVSSLILLPYLLIGKQYRLIFRRGVIGEVILLSIVGICGYNIFFTYGMSMTEPATGSLIIAANPVMTTLLSRIWKGEKISAVRWVGVCCAFAGLVYIVASGDLRNLTELKLAPGNLILLGAPFVWAIYSIRSKSLLSQMPTSVFTAAVIIFSLPIQVGMGIYQFENWHWFYQLKFWLPVFYLGVLATCVAYIFWNKGVTLIGAARSSIFMNLIPVTSIGIAALLGQNLYLYHFVGGAVVVLGVFLATRN
jgi:drug/metabolite transporter (DMT)-like permease